MIDRTEGYVGRLKVTAPYLTVHLENHELNCSLLELLDAIYDRSLEIIKELKELAVSKEIRSVALLTDTNVWFKNVLTTVSKIKDQLRVMESALEKDGVSDEVVMQKIGLTLTTLGNFASEVEHVYLYAIENVYERTVTLH